jgi:2-phospho-L-lactate/phosphoenolpyruvate guanylyltransferase
MNDDAAATSRVGVVIPIRSFIGAKERLAAHLDPDERANAFRRMAERVVDAASPLRVVIVSSAPEVDAWARARDLAVIDDPGSLNGAALEGVSTLASQGYERAVIAHADLPHAQSLLPVAADGAAPMMVIVPCHRDDGTNVLSLPVDVPFRFAYGPGSFQLHVAEAQRLGLEVRVLRAPDLMVDVDVAEDLQHLDSHSPT